MQRYQPYRNHPARPQTMALLAMLAGRPFHLPNPIDQYRLAQKRRRAPSSAAWWLR